MTSLQLFNQHKNCPRCKKLHLTEDLFCEHCLYQFLNDHHAIGSENWARWMKGQVMKMSLDKALEQHTWVEVRQREYMRDDESISQRTGTLKSKDLARSITACTSSSLAPVTISTIINATPSLHNCYKLICSSIQLRPGFNSRNIIPLFHLVKCVM